MGVKLVVVSVALRLLARGLLTLPLGPTTRYKDITVINQCVCGCSQFPTEGRRVGPLAPAVKDHRFAVIGVITVNPQPQAQRCEAVPNF